MGASAGPCLVVAYDGSAPARAAVRYAADRAAANGRVIVVHCFDLSSEWLAAGVSTPIAIEHSERGQAVLDDLMLTDGSVLADVHFEVELIAGEPAKTVNQVAEANDADEIVIGTRGSGRIAASLLGSVAQDVIRGADRPVVVIPDSAVEAQRASTSGSGMAE